MPFAPRCCQSGFSIKTLGREGLQNKRPQVPHISPRGGIGSQGTIGLRNFKDLNTWLTITFARLIRAIDSPKSLELQQLTWLPQSPDAFGDCGSQA